jgi:hypothetical protein
MIQKLYSVVCFQTRGKRRLSYRMNVQAAFLLWHWPHARRVYRSGHKYPSNAHRDVTLLCVTAHYTLFTGLSFEYQLKQSGSLQQRTDQHKRRYSTCLFYMGFWPKCLISQDDVLNPLKFLISVYRLLSHLANKLVAMVGIVVVLNYELMRIRDDRRVSIFL